MARLIPTPCILVPTRLALISIPRFIRIAGSPSFQLTPEPPQLLRYKYSLHPIHRVSPGPTLPQIWYTFILIVPLKNNYLFREL